MVKRALMIAFPVVLLGSVSCFVFACTSFAVYSGRTFYGMNFDYPPCEVRFALEEHEAGLVFIGTFWMGDHYGRTVGMNSQGLFSSCQMVSPAKAEVEQPSPEELYIWNAFYDGLQNCSCVGEVTDVIADKRLVQYPTLTLHNLYADVEGSAVVVEPGETGNVITEIDGPFMVMTNFPNGDFQGVDYHEVRGDGAHRYRTAYATIEEQLEDFDLDDAFETLERTVQSTGEYPTLYSLVFDPIAREVYIVLERDFDHIWKVSLDNQTIETHQGFDKAVILPMAPEGVLGSDLQSYKSAEVKQDWQQLAMIIAGLSVLGIGLVLLLARS